MEKNMSLLIQQGLRRKNKIKEEIERYSIIRAVTAVERADVVLIVIDATRRCDRAGCQDRRNCS